VNLPRATVPSTAADSIFAMLKGLAVGIVMVVVLGLAFSGWHFTHAGDCTSKADLAGLGAKKLAHEAYAMRAAQPGTAERCPSARELAEFSGADRDPWGHTYEVFCRRDGKAPLIVSRGADGKLGTRDDFDSTD
jgi:hypothetical protein